MTNEEIKDELFRMLSDVVNGGYPIRNNTQKGRYREAVELAIKALEQEPKAEVIDKIRAEIEHMIPCSKEALSMKLGVLEIIDKYKAESEVDS